MTFSAKDVADLRLKTGAGMMECKNALTEAKGNIEKAGEILRQKGLVAAAKKSEKTTLEGIVISKISGDKKNGAILELNTQTDFVAKNEKFIELASIMLDAILSNKPVSAEQVLLLKANGTLMSELVSSRIATLGENIQLRRFELFGLGNEGGIISTYIHPVGNKIGVLIKLVTSPDITTCIVELEELAKNIAMHIAASQPQPEYINSTTIPKDVIENERRIELGKEDLVKKTKEIAEKIVQGRLDKILAQRCLMSQPYIKDPNITIEKLIKEKSKQLNTDIKVSHFVRYNVGEVLEKDTSKEKAAVSIT
ncbi:MAG: translation elongation factor Ts [Candidatus Melainabacteria bacterium RIFCSPLOWO2_02_FULL_35_15]|nr:MAG: translation elongation factor Ts [Candidatus Melainabacteria bacterium RIFCSPLOWO2_12_FULL_35_11]OGI13561.1 MAG: translation elongation factor Ts [Candidatus Melainabacteria bacterium RIFCSPLOWO2_02_FULL_35_15]